MLMGIFLSAWPGAASLSGSLGGIPTMLPRFKVESGRFGFSSHQPSGPREREALP